MPQELVCAVDLGSNSFRLMVGRVQGDQIYPLDGLKESVRLAAGLGTDKLLDAEAQARALEALGRFGERLRGFRAEGVRAVATNTLRVAKNSPEFILRAEDALGFPIEVISGREEARLIYVGVAHSLPDPSLQQLVVDIGGGSTEFIIGRNFEPLQLESLYMGCVGYSLRFFKDGVIERSAMKEAELAARQQIDAIGNAYRETGWDLAVGSSGTAKALCDVLELNGLSRSGISREGLEKLRQIMLRAGHIDKLELEGLKSDRLPVFTGGFAIMSALFKEFELEHMEFSDGALRLGVLYDLLGRYHRRDQRDSTVSNFMHRYQVDEAQALRVTETALRLAAPLLADEEEDVRADECRVLEWSAKLHEIGQSIAHSSYHKHTAYILANADMPGFSRMDQGRLARIALAHRGKLERVQSLDPRSHDWLLIMCLRLAAIVHRSHSSQVAVPLHIERDKHGGFVAVLSHDRLRDAPLTAAALFEEEQHWARLGRPFKLKIQRAPRQVVEA
jgi:exopolyphosphatase / guanosine-5'-triphosphate,3'-diphosphate pyrophosphatase